MSILLLSKLFSYYIIQGVQEKLWFFFKEKFCHLSLASTGLLFVVLKIVSQ